MFLAQLRIFDYFKMRSYSPKQRITVDKPCCCLSGLCLRLLLFIICCIICMSQYAPYRTLKSSSKLSFIIIISAPSTKILSMQFFQSDYIITSRNTCTQIPEFSYSFFILNKILINSFFIPQASRIIIYYIHAVRLTWESYISKEFTNIDITRYIPYLHIISGRNLIRIGMPQSLMKK